MRRARTHAPDAALGPVVVLPPAIPAAAASLAL
jgi:hypothetical protein